MRVKYNCGCCDRCREVVDVVCCCCVVVVFVVAVVVVVVMCWRNCGMRDVVDV